MNFLTNTSDFDEGFIQIHNSKIIFKKFHMKWIFQGFTKNKDFMTTAKNTHIEMK